MPETPGELFTNVPLDLFRMGNASGPRHRLKHTFEQRYGIAP
jgi:hypothetical protein